MKVLHLSGSVNHWSGNEQQLVDLIENLNELQVENHIFCFKGSEIERYALKNQLPVHASKKQSIYAVGLAKQLKECVKKLQIDVIHVHTSNFLTVFMVCDLLFKLKTPTVFSRKGFSEKSSFLSSLKYNYKNIDRTICVSNAVKEGLKKFVKPKNHHKLRVIYDGIKTDKTSFNAENIPVLREKYHIEQHVFLVGNIANHVPAKDLETFVNTVDYLVNHLNIKEVHFIQIGKETAHTQAIKQRVADLHLQKYITFTGAIANAKQFIPQFDVFFMSSQSEGLPLTIYEAFLAGKPVVTTRAGGCAEAVTPNQNGFVCEIKDFTCLAKKINKIRQDDNLMASMGENALKTVHEKFDAKQCASNTLSLYKEIMK